MWKKAKWTDDTQRNTVQGRGERTKKEPRARNVVKRRTKLIDTNAR